MKEENEENELFDFDEYENDIEEFGFRLGCHAIDFSWLDDDKIKYICEAMRSYNKKKKHLDKKMK